MGKIVSVPHEVLTSPGGATEDLSDRLRLTVTRLARRLRQHSDPGGATPSQLSLLSTVERRGPITLGDLAAYEQVQPPTITLLAGRLENHGLLRRHPDRADRRVTRVAITPAGRRLLARIRSHKTLYLAQRLQSLSDDDRRLLADAVEVLDRVVRDETDAP